MSDEWDAIEARRRLLLTASPFDHAKWVQAQSILITEDVPDLLAAVRERDAELVKLRAKVMNLDRWVHRIRSKPITKDAVERAARALYDQRYGWGDNEDWGDREVQRIYHEEAEACLRAALTGEES